jgi:hypothetical protein
VRGAALLVGLHIAPLLANSDVKAWLPEGLKLGEKSMRVFSLLMLLLLGPVTATAATIAVSTFDTGTDGWKTGDFFSPASALDPLWASSPGFIRTTDIHAWNAFSAPAPFLGDQSAAYGGTLSLDMRSAVNDAINYPLVTISDGITVLQYRDSIPDDNNFTSYSISLLASAGWEVAAGSSGTSAGAATELQLQTVLGNLIWLNLDADWNSGPDRVDLDNVALCTAAGCATSVPEPSSMLAVSSGLVGLVALIARRRLL